MGGGFDVMADVLDGSSSYLWDNQQQLEASQCPRSGGSWMAGN
jgi:hypothetical protein